VFWTILLVQDQILPHAADWPSLTPRSTPACVHLTTTSKYHPSITDHSLILASCLVSHCSFTSTEPTTHYLHAPLFLTPTPR
jgi:hypothetical protein